ncbi:hypothetical protein PISL3812_09530 [Talaromyces islandicus]|uniref:Uncharacterized protein n=1 Tax=Talaromyces islandicus TaxID=28573 RepID=A0A0U1MAA4_TALIS|nr:hypothetical protein PISL3812_09530 [Talaromyces islandicus]
MAPSLPLSSLLVARFLRSNNYTETLDAFIREAGLPSDAGETTEIELSSEPAGADQWTLEGIIQEKKRFDQSLTFERHDESTSAKDQWTSLAPSQPTVVDTPSSTNLLHVSVQPWQRSDKESTSYVVATGADKRLSLFNLDADRTVAVSMMQLSDSPILSHASVCEGRYQFLTGMSGKLLLVQNDEVIDYRKDHSKYTVQVTAYEDQDGHIWIATAGWDAQVLLYRMKIEPSPVIGEPVGAIKLATNPESILITRNPDTQELTLLVSRRDSTHIYFYNLEVLRGANSTTTNNNTTVQCEEIGKQNLAPHSNAWVAFSPSCLALSPHDPGLLAVALSTMPHMKVIIVRLLFPSQQTSTEEQNESASVSQAAQAMAALALQNREDAAIVIQANTFAPQTPYSTPQVVWRPDGSGVWVNGDDGVIRGVEAKTGKVVTMLKNGHEVGSKVRSIWAGWVWSEEDSRKEEWVVSGGFDKRLIVWR